MSQKYAKFVTRTNNMSIFPRPLKKVLDKIIPFSQEDKIPTFNLGTGTADNTTYLRGDGTWSTVSASGGGIKSGTATYSTTDLYTTTISGVTSYTTNDAYIIKFNTANVDGASLNINGLGAISLVKNNNVNITGGDIRVGQEFLVVYDGTNFQMIGIAPNQMFAYVTNADSVTINKGQPVYAFGAAGDRMSVKLANNTTEATSSKTVGLVFSSSIAANGTGFIITQGVLSNVNTAAYAPGDTLYVGSSAGALTNTMPYAPNHLTRIGIVERANAGNGLIYVLVQNGFQLDELSDVNITTVPPVAGNVLTYNGSLWVPQTPSVVTNPRTIDLATGTNVTGSLAITASASILIPANTITTSSVIEVISRAIRVSGTASTIYHQMYINTSNTLTGATLLGVFNSLTATNYFSQGIRSIFIDPSVNQLTVVNAGATIPTDYVNTGANSVITFNETLNYYILFTIQLFNVGDTGKIQFAKAVLYE